MDRNLVIRKAQQSDIAALSEFAIKTYSAAFGHTFSDADLAAHLKRSLSPINFSRIIDDDVVLLAEVGDRIIGYVQFGAANSSSDDDKDQELRRLYVHPEFQNQGIGSRLVREGLDTCRRSGYGAVVVLGHTGFYPRFGFSTAKDYGLDNEYNVSDAFMVMELQVGVLGKISGLVKYAPEFREAGC